MYDFHSKRRECSLWEYGQCRVNSCIIHYKEVFTSHISSFTTFHTITNLRHIHIWYYMKCAIFSFLCSIPITLYGTIVCRVSVNSEHLVSHTSQTQVWGKADRSCKSSKLSCITQRTSWKIEKNILEAMEAVQQVSIQSTPCLLQICLSSCNVTVRGHFHV